MRKQNQRVSTDFSISSLSNPAFQTGPGTLSENWFKIHGSLPFLLRRLFPECLLGCDMEDSYWRLQVLSEWTGFCFHSDCLTRTRGTVPQIHSVGSSPPPPGTVSSFPSRRFPFTLLLSLEGLLLGYSILVTFVCKICLHVCLPHFSEAVACFWLPHLCRSGFECQSFHEKSIEGIWGGGEGRDLCILNHRFYIGQQPESQIHISEASSLMPQQNRNLLPYLQDQAFVPLLHLFLVLLFSLELGSFSSSSDPTVSIHSFIDSVCPKVLYDKAIFTSMCHPTIPVTDSPLHIEDALCIQWNEQVSLCLRQRIRYYALLTLSVHSKADKAEHR